MAELAYARRSERRPVRVRGSNPLGGTITHLLVKVVNKIKKYEKKYRRRSNRK